MRSVITLLLISSFVLFTSQKSENKNLIYWSDDVKLDWSDFKGKPDPSFFGAASTHSSISYSAEFENDSLVFHVYCYFDKTKSWLKEGQETSYLLTHEQLHFDISELYARMIRKGLNNESLTFENIQTKMDSIFSKLNSENVEMQTKYDKETEHSLVNSKQREWASHINNELKKLAEYSRDTYRRTIN